MTGERNSLEWKKNTHINQKLEQTNKISTTTLASPLLLKKN